MKALKEPSFESRIVRQSREIRDEQGNTRYEHNEYLEPGEKVQSAFGGGEMTIFKSRYWDLFSRVELVTVLVRDADGIERQREIAASAVRRENIASKP